MKTDIDTNFSFDLPKNRSNVMKVMGIGGGGSNAVNYMYKQGIKELILLFVTLILKHWKKVQFQIRFNLELI